MEEVKLHGAWPSPFVYRVIWALKLKGIPYEYILEDLRNKSPLLLKYNPIHKKVPVFVHGGKPICESTIILEYIEETWPETPLLPTDPYERAIARFWIKFFEDKGASIWKIFPATGDEIENGKKEIQEMLRAIEEHAQLGKKKFFGGEKIGMVDLVLGVIAHWLGVVQDLVGVTLLDADLFPLLHEWTLNFKCVPEIKENIPDRDEMFAFFKGIREMLLAKP